MLRIDSRLSIDTHSKKFKEDREIERLSDRRAMARRFEKERGVGILRQGEVLRVIVLCHNKALWQQTA